MRIRAKEELNTPKKQSEMFLAIQRKINDAWDILQVAESMAETLQLSTDDQTQYEAYDITAKFRDNIRSLNILIEDDLNIDSVNFEYQTEEVE